MSNKRPLAKASGIYKVGKGRPPLATRWKPGQSGNPKGRRRGRKNLATLFHEEMSQKVAISENGQRRVITKAEAAIKQLMNSAAKGNPKAIQAMINISKELGDLKLPDLMQEPTVYRFTLRVFDKDPITGERVQVEPGTNRKLEDNGNTRY
jgi:hypothetical protein